MIPLTAPRLLPRSHHVLLCIALWLCLAAYRHGGPAPLPPYQLDLRGEADLLDLSAGGPRRVARLGPGSLLEVVLRPQEAGRGPITMALYLSERGMGEARPWHVTLQISSERTFRLHLPAEALPRPGRTASYDLVCVVGRPGALPADLAQALATTGAFQVLRGRVDLVGADQ